MFKLSLLKHTSVKLNNGLKFHSHTFKLPRSTWLKFNSDWYIATYNNSIVCQFKHNTNLYCFLSSSKN